MKLSRFYENLPLKLPTGFYDYKLISLCSDCDIELTWQD